MRLGSEPAGKELCDQTLTLPDLAPSIRVHLFDERYGLSVAFGLEPFSKMQMADTVQAVVAVGL